jgi:aspartate carbamoyltransferase regulatory subunit
MYYIRVSSEDANSLIYYCRNCGNEDENVTKDNICVSKTQLKKSEQKFNHIVNRFTKFDPTLPHINSIRCPNSECVSNKEDGNRDVIYIRYDDTNKLYIYLCAKCDTVWKTEKSN